MLLLYYPQFIGEEIVLGKMKNLLKTRGRAVLKSRPYHSYTLAPAAWASVRAGLIPQSRRWCPGLAFSGVEGGKHRILGLTGREGLSTCLKLRKLYFQMTFLDGLIDLPTSIYWHIGSAEEAGGQPRLLVLTKARESFLPG